MPKLNGTDRFDWQKKQHRKNAGKSKLDEPR
jgi:hypothetical protein